MKNAVKDILQLNDNKGVLLLYDNARLHVLFVTHRKFQNVKWEVFLQPA